MRARWTIAFAGATAALLVLQAASQVSSSTRSSAAPAQDQFAKLCAGCHGEGATGTDRGPALVNNRMLRSRPETQIRDLIRNGTQRGMPPFHLPEGELQALTRWVRSLNDSAYDAKPAGDPEAGERFFFAKGQCGSCHMVAGRGKIGRAHV